MVIKFLVRPISISILTMYGCTHVRTQSSPLGDDKFLITCDGNGYASTGDTMQCISREANAICSQKGKTFSIVDNNTDSQLHVGVNPANGNPVPHMRPHSYATVQCH